MGLPGITYNKMKKFLLVIWLYVLTLSCLTAQDTIIPLWPKTAPDQLENGEKESDKTENIRWVRNVQYPVIEVYLPSPPNATGKAILIFPGGGYGGLAYDWEGTDFAKAFNSKGIAGIVVKYRLPISKSIIKNRHEVPLQDAQRAMRLVRSMAKTWSINPNKVGIMGFSAGGHLASSLGVHYNEEVYEKQDAADEMDARPDFMALIYPVITLDGAHTHMGSRNALLGDNQQESVVNRFSNEKHVNPKTPPTFLLHATDDQAVIVENSLLFFKALKEHDVPVTMHITPTGGHGFGLALEHPILKEWMNWFFDWLDATE